MWSRIRKLTFILPQLLQTITEKPRTIGFPFKPLQMSSGFRGRVMCKSENCVGCSLCVRDCPANALELHKESRKVYQLIHHPDRCAYCGQCELSCNFDAIYLDNQFVHGTLDRDSLEQVLVNRTEAETDSDTK